MSGESWRASSRQQLESCFKFLAEHMPETGWRIDYRPWKDGRSLSQNALSWKWYGEIADQIHRRTKIGPFDPQDIHDKLLVDRYGHEIIQIGTTEITRVPQSSKFDKSKMHDFLRWVEAWASERQIKLTIPSDSEYQKYKEAQIV